MVALVCLTGCAASGLQGLEANSIRFDQVIDRLYESLASCVAGELDRQPTGIGYVAILPNVWRHQEERLLIEVANVGHMHGPMADPSRMAYRLLFEGKADGSTAVAITARDNVHPFYSERYALDLIEAALDACSRATTIGDFGSSTKVS